MPYCGAGHLGMVTLAPVTRTTCAKRPGRNQVPMKRLGTIEEVIKSVAYLLSDDSSYSTGTNLVVAGGMA